MSLLLPTNSTLGPCSGTTAVYLKLTPDAIDSILASGGKNVKLRMGQKIEFSVNGQVYSTSSIPEPQHIDLYKSNGSKFDCIGKVSARYSVQRLIDSSSSSSSSARPKSSVPAAAPTPSASSSSAADSRKALLEAAGEIKRSSSARATPPHSHLKVQEVSKSTPTSPLINSSNGRSSSRATAAAAAAAAALPHKPLAQQSLTSAPIRVIHLLALGPNTPKVLAQRTGAPMAEVESILKEFCVAKGDGNFTLKDSTWKDIRVWEWKYSTFERNNVVKSAKAAFDRLKLGSDHQLRKNLIDPKTRPSAVSSSSSSLHATTTTNTNTNNTTTTTTNNNNTTPPYTYANSTEKSITPNRRLSPSKSSSPRVLPQPAQPQTSSSTSSSSSSSLSGAAPLKRKAAASATTNGPAAKRLSTGTSSKKEMAMKIGNWKELCGLVSRFKKHYPEYVRLYSVCDTHHPDYPRMVKMHNQLLGWKQTIWDNVPDDAPEEVKKWMKEITA